jgi:ferrous iron transport protein B
MNARQTGVTLQSGPQRPPNGCAACPVSKSALVEKHGFDVGDADAVVALGGNPNTGKSTIFNALTGLRQHVGNWPGKTVARAEGAFTYGGRRYRLIDLPGTYSLLSRSTDEEIARDALLFGQPDVTIVVVDATRLERNLNLTLQVLEITDRVVVALNLMDEAERHGLAVDERHLARELGVPVVPMAARFGTGLPQLLEAVEGVATGAIAVRPHRLTARDPQLEQAVAGLARDLEHAFQGLVNARWVAMRLIEGDPSVEEAVRDGSLGHLAPAPDSSAPPLGSALPRLTEPAPTQVGGAAS